MAQRKPPGIVAEICNADAARSRFACLTIALHLKRQYKLLRRSDAIFARGEFRVRAVEQSLDLNVEKSFECDVRPCAFVFASCLVDKCASTDARAERSDVATQHECSLRQRHAAERAPPPQINALACRLRHESLPFPRALR